MSKNPLIVRDGRRFMAPPASIPVDMQSKRGQFIKPCHVTYQHELEHWPGAVPDYKIASSVAWGKQTTPDADIVVVDLEGIWHASWYGPDERLSRYMVAKLVNIVKEFRRQWGHRIRIGAYQVPTSNWWGSVEQFEAGIERIRPALTVMSDACIGCYDAYRDDLSFPPAMQAEVYANIAKRDGLPPLCPFVSRQYWNGDEEWSGKRIGREEYQSAIKSLAEIPTVERMIVWGRASSLGLIDEVDVNETVQAIEDAGREAVLF